MKYRLDQHDGIFYAFPDYPAVIENFYKFKAGISIELHPSIWIIQDIRMLRFLEPEIKTERFKSIKIDKH